MKKIMTKRLIDLVDKKNILSLLYDYGKTQRHTKIPGLLSIQR